MTTFDKVVTVYTLKGLDNTIALLTSIVCVLAVTGCRDPEIPKNSWVKRDGHIATIGCKGKKTLPGN